MPNVITIMNNNSVVLSNTICIPAGVNKLRVDRLFHLFIYYNSHMSCYEWDQPYLDHIDQLWVAGRISMWENFLYAGCVPHRCSGYNAKCRLSPDGSIRPGIRAFHTVHPVCITEAPAAHLTRPACRRYGSRYDVPHRSLLATICLCVGILPDKFRTTLPISQRRRQPCRSVSANSTG